MVHREEDDEEGHDRRRFLELAGKGALLGLLWELLPAGGPLSLTWAQEAASGPNVHVVGLPRSPSDQAFVDAQVKRVLASVFDLERIQPGHTVVLKVAANSPYKYPMVAHPMVVRGCVNLAKERGAIVKIVDQPGFEHVFNIGDDLVRRKVREIVKGTLTGYSRGLDVHESNGMAQVAREAGVPIFAGDLESDYEQVTGPFQHWPKRRFGLRRQEAGFRVNKHAMECVRNKDTHHVISIVRPAAHVQAGHTGPTKTWYGWIYTADRLWSHIDLELVQDGDPFDVHQDHQSWKPWKWFGTKEVARLHECIAEVAQWMETNLPIRAHVLGAIDHFVDVGPDWAKVAMVRPNVIAAAATARPLDALHAAMLAEERSLTPRAERMKQALANVDSVSKQANTPEWRRQLETPLFYAIEHEFHELHGTHWWDDIVDALEKGDTARAQGAIYALRQQAESIRLEGGRPDAPPPVVIGSVDGEDPTSATLKNLIAPPSSETRGIIRTLPKGN